MSHSILRARGMYSISKIYIQCIFNNFSSKRTITTRPTSKLHQTTCMSNYKVLVLSMYNPVSMFIRCQGAVLFPSLPSHHHLHRCPGHVVCGWQGRHQTHWHLPGGLAETCTYNRNANKDERENHITFLDLDFAHLLLMYTAVKVSFPK